MSELKITQEKVTAAFSEANDCPKAISILTALFGKQKPDYTDYHNIKTYEDACEAIGVKPIVRLLVEDEDGHKEEVADIAHLAYIKLCTIARALNNDPDFPRFTKDEYRYTPWFYLYNQKEIDEMDEEDRNQLVLWVCVSRCELRPRLCGLVLRLVGLVCDCRLSPCCKIK